MRSIKFDQIGQKEVVRARPVNPPPAIAVAVQPPTVASAPKPPAPPAK